MQSTPKTLLFDLDGTLSDPLVGIARSINYALSHFGFPECSLEDLAVHVGPPLDQSFRLITGLQSGFAIESLVAKYRERYGQIGYSENVLYPGIPEVLEQFARTGVTLGLCTSKRADFAEQILELFGLRSYFDFISGGEIGVGKSQQIRALLHEGVVTTSTVMVGDRAVDITAAQQNGLLAAGVLWGYGSRQELEAEKPRYLFASPEELLVLADARLKAKAAQ